jgi:hypothetical protein
MAQSVTDVGHGSADGLRAGSYLLNHGGSTLVIESVDGTRSSKSGNDVSIDFNRGSASPDAGVNFFVGLRPGSATDIIERGGRE